MDQFVYSGAELPDELYRIRYPESKTVFSEAEGFRAADTSRVFGADEVDEFGEAVGKQFTWGCRERLPFISLFSSREHAENWGRKEMWRYQKDLAREWSLCVIDPTILRASSRIFKLDVLVEKLELKIPKKAEQHIKGAFLCLHRIPKGAIVEERTPQQVEEDRAARFEEFYRKDTELVDNYGENNSSVKEKKHSADDDLLCKELGKLNLGLA
ncbi:hypothetical protein BS50DRAFT_626560 [Corynespora cassiicola Philippines]|uniref:DUF7587 domain-containing protein n=1 Tax=Corynespora cassiicola Philippines TaxID=1448308 RepID=A0A2T2N2E4_CORCC|nr:hypothetical protein BS50DRAFT_626560 [Corynespora cassiicola Philippines]